MPGLFGVVDTPSGCSEHRQRELVDIVRRMSAVMLYESTYTETIVSCPTVSACVGRVGHADPTTRNIEGHGDIAIVLTTGESGPGLVEHASDHRIANGSEVFRSSRSGEDLVSCIAGRCAAFVAERRTGACFLFNDRYGRERLFVHAAGSRTFFSSEAKAILAVAPQTRDFDITGLAEMLACGCTLGSRSLFRDIEVLAPGTILTFTAWGVRRRRYFKSAELEGLEPASGPEFLEGFADSLRTAVGRSVRESPRVGISLTGGLDSRMIMASLDAPEGSVPCYTFGSMFRPTGDVLIASQVAARCGQPHHVLELGKEFLARIRPNLEHSVYVSDGYLGLSGAAEFHANRQARVLAPARMTGNWGGELMRGVRAFKFVQPKGRFIAADLAAQMSASAEAFSRAQANSISAALFDQIPYQGYGRYAIERSQLVMRSPFLDDDVVRWLYRAPASVRASGEGAAAVIGRRPDLLTIPTDMGLLGLHPSFVRRISRRLLIKAEYLTSHGAPDWLTRIAASIPASLLETRFLGVDKFQHFRLWTRRDFAGYVRDTLLHDATADLGTWFDMRRVAQMVRDHVAGYANYTDEIDRLMTVAIARKMLFKRLDAVP
jgi:asparagine synthase (glutamine-hydrolysing)